MNIGSLSNNNDIKDVAIRNNIPVKNISKPGIIILYLFDIFEIVFLNILNNKPIIIRDISKDPKLVNKFIPKDLFNIEVEVLVIIKNINITKIIVGKEGYAALSPSNIPLKTLFDSVNLA